MSETRAYSYRRFSSGRQAAGHSLERQTEAARRWCAEHDCVLDETLALADLGVSAYSGENASKGALSAFLAAANSGKVPRGSVLIVESLDRLSRSAIPEAVGLLTSIVRAGVRVVSLIDGHEWNERTINDTANFMMSVLLFSRAHEESATKAKRVSAAFQRKRDAKLPVVSAGHGPGWATPLEDRSGWRLLDDRAKSVQAVFALAAEGYGGIAIARKANEEAWPLPWRVRANTSTRWEHTGVSRLLRDRRVLGEWQPKRMVAGKLVPDGDPVQDYFPRVVSEKQWLSAQSALSTRQGPQRLRGRKADVFAGLFFCQCGERMDRKAPSGRGYARYYCVGRINGATDCPPIAEAVVTEKMLAALVQAEQRSFNPAESNKRVRDELEQASFKLAEMQENAAKLLDVLEKDGPNTLIIGRLKRREAEVIEAEKEVERLKTELATTPLAGASFGDEYAARAARAIADPADVSGRHELVSNLYRVVKRITWHGNFLMAEFKTAKGAGVGVTVYADALARAKNRNAKAKGVEPRPGASSASKKRQRGSGPAELTK